jgi:polysaccharide export outer membrane protein
VAPDGYVQEGPAVAPDGAPADIIKVDVRAIQSGELDKNIPLLPHDTIYVPPAPKFFIIGEANSPGAYTLPPNTTVREAVIMAGGFSPNASTKKIRVIRRVDGKEEEIKVSLEDIVQPGDTIVVKASLF